MKRNLRNILALSLGLMTTVAFAQDWGVDSRTRIDMSGDHDKFEGAQRATVGTTWGGSNWGVHVSTEINYDLNNGEAASLGVYEAHASTDLMGWASLTVGRQALEYGSGTLIGKNDWGSRNVRDGMTFGLNLDMADVTLGYYNRTGEAENADGWSGMYINASKSEGDWSANLLYGSEESTFDGVEDPSLDWMGLDLGYNMMDGNLALNMSYNTVSMDAGNGLDAIDADMTVIGATYSVNESMSIMGSMTTMGDESVSYTGGNLGSGPDSWITHGNIGFQGANDEMMTIGGNYSMGSFDVGVAMYTVTNDNNDGERNATEFNLGYELNDNSSLSLKYVTDNHSTDEDTKYMWMTLNVGL